MSQSLNTIIVIFAYTFTIIIHVKLDLQVNVLPHKYAYHLTTARITNINFIWFAIVTEVKLQHNDKIQQEHSESANSTKSVALSPCGD